MVNNDSRQYIDQLSSTGQIAFAILCAKEVYNDKRWNDWADKWLSGEDRGYRTATFAYTIADHAIPRAADHAAYRGATAGYAAAYAAYYADYNSNAADYTPYNPSRIRREIRSHALDAALYAGDIDFKSIFEKAKQYDTEQSNESFNGFTENQRIYQSMNEALRQVYENTTNEGKFSEMALATELINLLRSFDGIDKETIDTSLVDAYEEIKIEFYTDSNSGNERYYLSLT